MSISGEELLHVVESVAKDKGLSKDIVLQMLENAVAAAGSKKYGKFHKIQVRINKKDGVLSIYRVLTVVDTNKDDDITQISFEDARVIKPDCVIGDVIEEKLPPLDLSCEFAEIVKRAISQEFVTAEKEREYDAFHDRVGDMISGVVKSVERNGGVMVGLAAGNAEGWLARKQMLPVDNFKIGDRVKAYIYKVERRDGWAQIFLSRTDEQMLAKLFALEVPEIYDDIVQIKAIARDPGSKAKIAVYCSDDSIDAVRCCVGSRGARVQAVSHEMNGEKIDVVKWSSDLAQFVVNALSPAVVEKVVIHQSQHVVETILQEDQLSLAIGRKGQNVGLASHLVGWEIRIVTADDASAKRLAEFQSVTSIFKDVLDIDEVLAQLLISEGFDSLSALANATVEQVAGIEGLNSEIAEEVITRAVSVHKKEQIAKAEFLQSHGVDDELCNLLSMVCWEDFVRLVEYGIKTVEDLGAITDKEFQSCVINKPLDKRKVRELISHAKNTDH
ncbi:transcription termination factor NusA [Candidatus Sneabacter namystus]|uniref:Transcription termination/antitermination protein NusA n=1 Tax=Candidatus Sneabacter namystus TaxID=2601646 RepID=A0A5C0UIH0_9RICK|nr:transcription termination factor NusA [Candidatus Sneabacter namystus]QEK39866.1 transcription termination factor NusA [Candidatus Sneabacter namystus]